MLTKKMEDELNKQVNAEFYSSYLYLSMASYLDVNNLGGISKWMNIQAQEEWGHGLKIFNFINERGGKVKLDTIKKPKQQWKDVIDLFTDVFEHEKKVTKLINGLMDIAIKESDYATKNFLQWFVEEQVEEEASASEILEQLKMVAGNGTGLFMIDRELGTRSLENPEE